jgi:predicted transcriptional regulator
MAVSIAGVSLCRKSTQAIILAMSFSPKPIAHHPVVAYAISTGIARPSQYILHLPRFSAIIVRDLALLTVGYCYRDFEGMANLPVKQDYREKFTLKQIEDALRAANGNQSKAAEMLHTSRSTVNGYVKRYPELVDVIAEIKESNLDIAENALISKIKEGNMAAIIFFLKTQGKSRGYDEKAKPPVDEPQRPDFESLSTDELQKLAAQLQPVKRLTAVK